MQIGLLFNVASLFWFCQGPLSANTFINYVQALTQNPFSGFVSHRTHQSILSFGNANDSSSSMKELHASPVAGQNVAVLETRRSFLIGSALNVCAIGAAGTSFPSSARAADEASTVATRYISGKPPQVAGQTKPQEKSNLKGTKKDPDFLRSIADCRSQCQNTADSDGLAKSKEDCLSECQDICCTTYEQCTFNIVPRL